jgi:hypothetical protein
MSWFNREGPLGRAQRCLDSAARNLETVRNDCTLAKVNLSDAGRETQATAIEMICASITQLQDDLRRWTALVGKTRNGD